MMKGWKTYTGVGLAFVCAGLEAIGYSEIAKVVGIIAAAFGVVGVAHKIEKASK